MIPMVRTPRSGITLTAALWVLVALVTLMSIVGCSSGPSVCQEVDWYEIGRRDGLKGLEKNSRRQVNPVCSDSDQSLSEAFYNNGFDAGVARFCNPKHGYELGRAGKEVAGLCPPLLEAEFIKAHEHGRKMAELERLNRQLSRRIQSLDQDLSDRATDIVRRGLIEGEKLQLLEQQEKLKQEITRIQAQITES